jgi:hypothetical protein
MAGAPAFASIAAPQASPAAPFFAGDAEAPHIAVTRIRADLRPRTASSNMPADPNIVHPADFAIFFR